MNHENWTIPYICCKCGVVFEATSHTVRSINNICPECRSAANKERARTVLMRGMKEAIDATDTYEYKHDCAACQDIAGQAAADWKARAEKAEAVIQRHKEWRDACLPGDDYQQLFARAEKAEAKLAEHEATMSKALVLIQKASVLTDEWLAQDAARLAELDNARTDNKLLSEYVAATRLEREKAIAERNELASHILHEVGCKRCPLQGSPEGCHMGRENMTCLDIICEWARQKAAHKKEEENQRNKSWRENMNRIQQTAKRWRNNNGNR